MLTFFLALMLSMTPRERAEYNNALCTLHLYGYWSDPLPYCMQHEGDSYICVAVSSGKLIRMRCAGHHKEPCTLNL